MPYKKIGDANKAILGIKPRVSLEQANEIAAMADAISEEGQDKAWPIAISQWKKSHTVRNGKWIKRSELNKENDMSALVEAVMKTVGGKKYPASDFLVVEDPEKPDSWHLQVKESGKPNHDLMGGAHAALLAQKGHRGNKYEGPNKQAAISKLKSLYKSEDMEWPMKEMEVYEAPESVYMATTFKDLYAQREAHEAVAELQDTVSQFGMLAQNIIDSPAEDKPASLKALAQEFVTIVHGEVNNITDQEEAGARMNAAMLGRLSDARKTLDEIHSWGSYSDRQQESEQQAEEATQDEQVETFAESVDGAGITLAETEALAEDAGRRGPLSLDFIGIRPGWGNKRNMHYYPRETLARDAGVFIGKKMYATNHIPGEKNVINTEVGVIDDIKGFTDDGAPVYKATIFHPTFAEIVRNRSDAKKLNTLECSILASGRSKPGAVDGIKGKIVEAITDAQSIDWVTKAGAGGQALQLSEAEQETQGEAEQEVVEAQQVTAQEVVDAVTETQVEQLSEEVQANEQQAEVQEVRQEEVAEAQQEGADEATQTEAATEQQEQAGEVQQDVFSEAQAGEIITASVLPEWAQEWLKEKQWTNAEELQAGIARAIQRVKKATRSGEVFAQGASRPLEEKPVTPEQLEEKRIDNFNAIMRKHGAREV